MIKRKWFYIAVSTIAWSGCLTGLYAQEAATAQQTSSPSITQTPKAPEPVLDSKGQVILENPAPEAAAGDPLYAPLAVGGPQTLHQKFMDYAVITYGPRALATPAFGAAIRQANPRAGYPPAWQTGIGAFGRNYGDDLARKGSFQTVQFGASALLHEDTRYRPSTSRNPWVRGLYAISFTVVDRSDTGHVRLAISNFAGASAEGYIPNLYLPAGYNDVTHADQRMLRQFDSLAIRNIIREFSPEIYRTTQKLHIPFPRIPIPEWWTSRPDGHHHR